MYYISGCEKSGKLLKLCKIPHSVFQPRCEPIPSARGVKNTSHTFLRNYIMLKKILHPSLNVFQYTQTTVEADTKLFQGSHRIGPMD